MRCDRSTLGNHAATWKKVWSSCANAPWAKHMRHAATSATPGSAEPPANPDSPPVAVPPQRSSWVSTALLNPLTNLLLALSICLVIGGWAFVIQSHISYVLMISQRAAPDEGLPSPVILEEGLPQFSWLANYKLGEKNLLNGNEVLLVVSPMQPTRAEALENARRNLSTQILKRHHERYGNHGVGSIPQEDLVTWFPMHEGTLEKPITAGQFSVPMYRTYLLATIPDSGLERLDASQKLAAGARNANLLLGSILLAALIILSLVITFRIDLATHGRRRWLGNLIATAFLLVAGAAGFMTMRLMPW